METGSTINVIVSTGIGSQVAISVSNTLTGYQLKQYIYKNVTKSLEPLSMNLYYAGIKIENDKKLASYNIIQGNQIKILQSKVELDQIPGLIVSYEEDQISLQTTTARMPCGHVIGRDCMTQFIRSLVQSRQFKIICPSYKPGGQRCQTQWDYALCKKIGVFTAEETKQFQVGLSKNWILQNTIQCPSCKQNLFKGELKTNRVVCPRCKYGDFCSQCLRKWNSQNHTICGNKECKAIDLFLQKCPWNKLFKLKDSKNNTLDIKTPSHRACPKCSLLIQHNSGCKHMKCINCKQSFCWVCLERCQKGVWKCGSFNTYCGKIAPVQKTNN